MFEKRKKYIKHAKEYRKELFKMKSFWIGLLLVAVGFILGGLHQNPFIATTVFTVGFVFMISAKYRIIGRLEEKYDIK